MCISKILLTLSKYSTLPFPCTLCRGLRMRISGASHQGKWPAHRLGHSTFWPSGLNNAHSPVAVHEVLGCRHKVRTTQHFIFICIFFCEPNSSLSLISFATTKRHPWLPLGFWGGQQTRHLHAWIAWMGALLNQASQLRKTDVAVNL